MIFDCYSPVETKPVRGIWTEVHDKVVKKKQTQRVVINLADWAGERPNSRSSSLNGRSSSCTRS
jgi:hypothetical protein